jgi:hypothetical protein
MFGAVFMGISFPKESKSKAAGARALRRKAEPRRVPSKNFLYRISGSFVILALFLAAANLSGLAQQPQLKRRNEAPEEKPPEPKKKKVKGPRAVGILQLNSDGKGSLIPVAILIDGHFYDASAYKADPVPMALESGTVSGVLRGSSASATPWVGTGAFLPQGTELPKTTRKAEDVPVGIDSSGDEPPRLTKKPSSAPAAKSDPGSSASAPPSTQTSSTQPNSDKSADKSPATASPTANAGSDKTSSDKPSGAANPSSTVQAPSGPSAPTSAGGATSKDESSKDQSSDNYYRPTLRRGKPTQDAPENKDEVVAKPVSTGAATASTPGASASNSGTIRLIPAISDSGGPEPRSYKFFWKTGEEEERRNQMLTLAANEVLAYEAQLAKNHIPANPVKPKTAASRKGALNQAKPVFENIQFRVFDLWLTNQPVMIFSADAHIPGSPETAEPYSVLLVARTDIYGNLIKIQSSISDRFHLDVSPRLELIDVVDADGDGRGELLFRETSDAGSGYIIYRATADKLWKMFDSLHAE